MKLYFATGNAHKLAEVARLFAGVEGITVHSATEVGGMPPVEETAPDFAGNARLKAEALARRAPAGAWVLADDSGLEVTALHGEPGVRSARFAGLDATDAENRAKLLARLDEVKAEDRRARFVCVLVLLGPNGEEETFTGICPGRIVEEERGEGGFGYDPLFVADGLDQTFAEVVPGLKDRLSHRGQAFRALLKWFQS